MSGISFKPMLAGKVDDFAKLRFPTLCSFKLDGVRCLAMDGKPMTRSMKEIPNRFIQRFFAENKLRLEGLDGELIVGPPNVPTTYNATVSAVMRQDGEPDFTYWCFDMWDRALNGQNYSEGVFRWPFEGEIDRVKMLSYTLIQDHAALSLYEESALLYGYEGVMLRDPAGPYKQGRSSFREGYLLKVKRYEDSEAIVIGFQEEMHNGNEAFTSELGRTKRSSHQENLVGKGTLGALVVKGLTAYPGVEFNIGTGFDAAQRASLWQLGDELNGRIVKFKHFPIGAKDAPRHPVFLGFRDPIDMG
jgi:DNA ligase-1